MEKCNGIILVRSAVTERKIKIWEECHCVWIIKNFSDFDSSVGFKILSPEFSATDSSKCRYQLCIYPNGSTKQYKDFISLYVSVVTAVKYPVFAKYSFTLRNTDDCIIKTGSDQHLFSDPGGYGWPEFVEKNELTPKICNDIVEVVATISCVSEELENSHKIEFRKNSSTVTLANEIYSMFEDEKFCDLVLVTSAGEEIKAHRIILSARSSVFSAMFAHDHLESVTGKVEIRDFSAKTVRAMLEYIYSGQTDILDTNMGVDLLRVADKYDLQDLKLLCVDYLSINVSSESAENILLVADMTESTVLKEYVMQYIVDNPMKFKHSNRLDKLETENPRLLKELLFLNMDKFSTER